MNNLLGLFIHRYKVVAVICLAISILGFYCYHISPKQENPDTSSPAAVITTIYPGASSYDVERYVTKPIEQAASLLSGIDEIESKSLNSASIVIVRITPDVDNQKQWDMLRSELDKLEHSLPAECKKPYINTELNKTAGVIFSITSDEQADFNKLSTYADELRKGLLSVDGVSSVEISGLPEIEITVLIKQEALNQTPFSVEDVFKLVASQNIEIPAGQIKSLDNTIDVIVPGRVDSLNEISNIVLMYSQETGQVLRLGDVADIYIEELEKTKTINQNEKKALLVTLYFEENQNILFVNKEINNKIHELQASFPEGINIDKIVSQPDEVNSSVNNFLLSLLIGMGLVLIVIFIGMGIRNAIIVSVSIPLTISITFAVMYWLGIDIQQMSIAGLIISLGILVDNSIVISDAVQVKLDEGYFPQYAALEGTREQAIPVLTSTLTTLAAFAPLTILPGAAGQFAKSLPQVVFIALSTSYLVAMFVTPALTIIFSRPRGNKNTHRQNRIRHLVSSLPRFGIKNKVVVLLATIILFVASVVLAISLNIDLFPYVDKGIIYLNVEDAGQEEIMGIYEYLSSQKEVEQCVYSVNGSLPKFYLTSDMVAEEKGSSQFYVIFRDKSLKSDQLDRILRRFERDIYSLLPDTNISVKRLELTEGGPDFKLLVAGDDIETLNTTAEYITQKLLEIDGTKNVENNTIKADSRYVINTDNNKLMLNMLSKYDVQRQLNLALYGDDTLKSNINGVLLNMHIHSDILEMKDLNNFMIKSSVSGQKVRIGDVATIEEMPGIPSVLRLNGQRAVEVSCDVSEGYNTVDLQRGVDKEINTGLKSLGVDTESLSFEYYGLNKTMSTYLNGLDIAALFAIVCIYIILMLQFNSFKQPIIILVTVPLSLIGTVLLFYILNLKVTFTVLLGIISLMGIVVNNAILIIEYINRARINGFGIDEACLDSVEKRFRPIMMSTITTIVGLIPLALSGSSFFSPMAAALIGGLMVSTVFTMIIIPVLYSIMIKKMSPLPHVFWFKHKNKDEELG